jgi:hypothetical protein
MRVAIMQPTFAPWLGYFELMSKTDLFIFLDDVEYSHQSWQARNWFLQNGEPILLSVPINKPKMRELICDKTLHNPSFFQKKFKKRFMQMYSHSERLEHYLSILEQYFSDDDKDLATRNIKMILELSLSLGIKVKCMRSSKIPITGSKSNYIHSILQFVGATSYLATPGAKQYMLEYGIENFPCEIDFNNYQKTLAIDKISKHRINFSSIHYLLSDSTDKVLNLFGELNEE